jgi:hypothetical protein
MARLHRHDRRRIIPIRLGRDDLTTIEQEVAVSVAAGDSVVLQVTGYDYFDITMLERLIALADAQPELVALRGLTELAESIVEASHEDVAVTWIAPDAVTHLGAVSVVVTHRLPGSDWGPALAAARDAGRPLVTVDLRYCTELTANQLSGLFALHHDLRRADHRLLLVNANPAVVEQLEASGLAGCLRMSINDLM